MKKEEQTFQKLIEKIKSDQKLIKVLKSHLVEDQEYELAADLREIETKEFPMSDEQIKVSVLTNQLETVFKLFDMKINHRTIFLLYLVFDRYARKGTELSLVDVTEIQGEVNLIFNI